MRCPTCRGLRTIRQIRIWQRRQNGGLVNCSRWVSVPCPECGGCRQSYCCDGAEAPYDGELDGYLSYFEAIKAIGESVRAGAPVPRFLLSQKG